MASRGREKANGREAVLDNHLSVYVGTALICVYVATRMMCMY